MKRKKLTTLLLGISVVLMLAATEIISACAQPAQVAPAPQATPTTPIRIGLLQPTTGPFAILGEGVINGFKMGMEEAGYKVAGRSIEVILLDEGLDPSFTMDNARKMVEGDKIDIMVGPFNTNVRLPVLPYTSSKKVPNIACVCDTPEASKFPYVYSPVQSVFSTIRPLGWFAYDELDVRTVTTIGNDWHAGRDFTDGFLYGFTKDRPGKVVQQQWSPFDTADYSSYLVNMKPADAISSVLMTADLAAFLTQANQMGILKKMPVLELGGGVLEQMLPQLGPIIVGHYWRQPEWAPGYDSPVNNKFKADYQVKYGNPADVFAASGYTRAQIVLDLFKGINGNTDPDVMHEAIKAVKVDTPQGPIAFTQGKPDKSDVQGIILPHVDTPKLVDGQYVYSVVKEYPPLEPMDKP